MKLHEQLTELRKKRGWSQQDLADKLEMHVTSINRMENGKMKVEKTVELAIKYLKEYS